MKKLGFMKRVLAIGICGVMLLGDNVFSTAFASVSGGDAVAFTEENSSVSGNDLLNSVSDGDLEDIVLVTETSGVTITLTAPAGSLPENAELWAEEIDQTSQLAIIDEALEAEAEKEEIEVQKYKAFDIKILVDGEEVQPAEGVTVAFAGDILLPQTEEESVTVYHVTEDAVANDMEATVTEANEVEMETNHFSIYVITVSMDASNFAYDVTIQHKLADDTNMAFYKDMVQTITKNDNMLVGVQGGGDYDVTSVVIQESNDTPAVTIAAENIRIIENENGRFLDVDMETYKISSDTVVTVYYAPKTNTFTSDVTFFDYSVMSEDGTYVNGGINANIFNADGSVKSNYLGMGMNGYHTSVLNVINRFDNNNLLDANANSTNNPDNNWVPEYDHLAIAEGLVTGLSADDGYQTVIWGTAADGQTINAPGYFSADAVEGKTILNDRFDLQFTQTGHKYVLDGSIDTGNANAFTAAGKGNAGFFPLNAVEHNDTAAAISAAGGGGEIYNSLVRTHGEEDFDYDKGNNCYFGMRYDFKFSIGDYVGPLEYTFEGDDDLWVFMDGKVVLDLGGIHSAYPSAYPDADTANGVASPVNYVDLWHFIKDENGNFDPNATHQITVLYMERGGYDSTCYMEFILPNATAMKSVISSKPTTNFAITKVDEQGTGVGGAHFELKNLVSGEVDTAISAADGSVRFDNIYEGTYLLIEKMAPEGYVLDGVQHTVNVAYNSGNWNITGLPANGNVVNKKLTDITFKKVDRYHLNTGLEGAEFELWNAQNQLVGTAVSTANGNFAFNDLVSGVYTLKETKAPEGYASCEDTWTIVVDAYAERPIVSVTGPTENQWSGAAFLITNEKEVELTIEKIWQDLSGKEIEDVEVSEITVTIMRQHKDATLTQNCSECDAWSQTITLTKENNWSTVVSGLAARDNCGEYEYYVVENHVEGYVAGYVNGEKTETAHGYAQTLTVINTPATGSLVITKTVDEINMAYGAPTFTFKIEGPEGVLYRTITFDDANVTTKSITVEDILVGEYTVTELDTLRYTLNEAKSSYSPAVVTDSVTPEFKFYNELTNDDDYSHSDVVVNSFRQNDNGEIEISKNLQVIE
uniref:SpaA isopeptide-forming pilin-related protein n=1 Tax=Acetatifactor sp. TaxID=1872090 RepID=UPI004055EEC5